MTPGWADRWLEISVEADRESVDDLVGLLGRHCPGGAAVEYRPVETLQGVGERATVKGFLPACDKETCRKLEIVLLLLGQTSPISAPQIRTLEPRDWSESWKAFFPPQHIGARTVIVPTWRDHTPGPGEVVIRLDPGMAFGTGLHASTRLCLILTSYFRLTTTTKHNSSKTWLAVDAQAAPMIPVDGTKTQASTALTRPQINRSIAEISGDP